MGAGAIDVDGVGKIWDPFFLDSDIFTTVTFSSPRNCEPCMALTI
jgi:hypothetical protein